MRIDVENFFKALLGAGLTVLWGCLTYIFCTGTTDVGFAGLLCSCAISGLITIHHLLNSFGNDEDGEM